VLANPGFELDANGDGKPDSWSIDTRAVRDGPVTHGGAFAMRHRAIDNGSYILRQNATNIASGKDYAFNAWVKISATSAAFTFRMDIVWRSGTGVPGTTPLKAYAARPVGVYYAYCDANCATPGTWFETQMYQGPEFKSLAFEYPLLKFTTTGQPRLVSNITFSGVGQGVLYLQCDTNCGTLAGWKGVKLFDRGGGTSASWDLELDAAGQPRIAYADYYPLGNVPGLGYAWCNAACETTASWKRQTIDPSSVLNAEFPVA
jgi:hypothetical protein